MTVSAEAMRHIEVAVPGLRRDADEVGELAGVFWDFAALIEAEGILDGLDQHDANMAMEGVVAGLVLSEDNGAHRIRESAVNIAGGHLFRGGSPVDLHDPVAVARALCIIATLVQVPM